MFHTQLTGNPNYPLSVNMGLGIARRYAKDIGLITDPPVSFSPRSSGIMCHLTLKNPLEIYERDLLPLIQYAQANEREISGSFHTRLSHISVDHGEPLYHFFLHAALV